MQDDLIEKVEIPKYLFDIINDLVPEKPLIHEIFEKHEISTNYDMNHIICNQNEVNIDETFTLDATMLQYLIILVAQQSLHLHLLDDVTAYLYGSLQNHIYMKILEGFYCPNKANSKEGYSIKLNKLFY